MWSPRVSKPARYYTFECQYVGALCGVRAEALCHARIPGCKETAAGNGRGDTVIQCTVAIAFRTFHIYSTAIHIEIAVAVDSISACIDRNSATIDREYTGFVGIHVKAAHTTWSVALWLAGAAA